ncbi:MAG: hypothetical protein KC502_17770, partial [Myxococcales bacterium]|nr:hypothetical protein [Myxococcales bacterium]
SSSSSSFGSNSSSSAGDDWILAAYIVTSPWWGPRAAMGDSSRHRFAYLSHPYANNHPGFIVSAGRDRPQMQLGGRSVLGQGMSVRASVDGGMVDSNLGRMGVSGVISGRHRFEVETRWDLFTEAPAEGGIDRIWLGDVNLTYQHAVGRHGQFRAGVGIRSLVDAEGNRHGFNFTYGFDLYPVDPIVIHAAFDAGNVGTAGFVQLHASVGVMMGPMELYAGYDQTWVDDIDLGSPVVGLRLWR